MLRHDSISNICDREGRPCSFTPLSFVCLHLSLICSTCLCAVLSDRTFLRVLMLQLDDSHFERHFTAFYIWYRLFGCVYIRWVSQGARTLRHHLSTLMSLVKKELMKPCNSLPLSRECGPISLCLHSPTHRPTHPHPSHPRRTWFAGCWLLLMVC